VSWRKGYLFFTGLLILLGVMLLVSILLSIAQCIGRIAGLALTGILLLIVVGISIPTTFVHSLINFGVNLTGGLVPVGSSASVSLILDLGHVVFFFLIALLLFSMRERLASTTGEIVYFLFLVIVLTEGIQLHLISRSAGLMDILLDLFGIGLATLFLYYRSYRTSNQDIADSPP